MSKPMSEQMQKLAERYEKATGKKFNSITNADHIRSMTDEELVEHNVHASYEYTVDYDWDENPIGEYEPCWRTTDGSAFWDYDEALEYELEWLKQPYKDGGG